MARGFQVQYAYGSGPDRHIVHIVHMVPISRKSGKQVSKNQYKILVHFSSFFPLRSFSNAYRIWVQKTTQNDILYTYENITLFLRQNNAARNSVRGSQILAAISPAVTMRAMKQRAISQLGHLASGCFSYTFICIGAFSFLMRQNVAGCNCRGAMGLWCKMVLGAKFAALRNFWALKKWGHE